MISADIIISKKDVFVIKIMKDDEERFLKVKMSDFDVNLDADRITKIDLNNLVAEIVIAPVLLNRWGIIQASVEAEYNKKKVSFEIFCAKERERLRNDFVQKGKKITIDAIDDALLMEPEYEKRKFDLIEAQKGLEICKSVYWSLKEKNEQLNKLSLTIQKEDIKNITNLTLYGISIITSKRKVTEEED